KKDLEKMGGTALFVAVPIPLTGVWTGSAVASIVKIGFFKALVSVIVGNAVACGIMALLSWAFAPYIDYITIAFAVLALCVVVFLIVKLILYKPKDEKTEGAGVIANADVNADASANGASEENITPSVNGATVDHDELNDSDRSG
ncbi:MAG: small multi-drug export protein, partial [Clostridiales bacterium]|nr:small multi-drug export protein [Clostridiales bacterium]